MKKKSSKCWISTIFLVIFILIFVGSGWYLFDYFREAKVAEGELLELVELKTLSEEEEDDTEVIKTKTGKKILKRYKKLYKKNKDIVGWITVKNTPIDYPVMQTKEDSEFYLHKNYNKEYDVNGLPFLDANCDIENEKSNLMVYGHHMKSGLMFAHLLDFAEVDFYKKHKQISFDTLYESQEYEVVAAFYSQVYNKEDKHFKYYNYPGALSQKQFKTYVENIKKMSLYDTGITPKYGDQLLTLVTCSYHVEEGRFVVVARRRK